MPTTTPVVVEGECMRERSYDIFSRLMKDRIIFLGDPIVNDVANIINAQLLFLEQQAQNKEINVYINSPGGDVICGLSIYDTMNHVKCPITTICMGNAASMAAVLFAGGENRYMLPHSRVMIHQPMGKVGGQSDDIEIQTEELIHQRSRLYEILSKHTGHPVEKIEEDCKRDNYLHPEEAVEYGIADKVLDNG